MVDTTARKPHWAALIAAIGRLHIVAIAGLGTLTFGYLKLGYRPWFLAAITCLDWFIVNLLNRAVDVREDRANGIVGTEFVAARRPTVLCLGATLLAASLVAVHLIEPALTPLRLAYHLLGAAYNWPILPGHRRLKELYGAKNAASAMGFVITLFGYPLVIDRPEITASTALAAAFFVLFELSWEVVYDMRDVRGDRLAGVRTFAVVHGLSGAKRIADALLVSSAVVLLGGFALSLVPLRLAVMVTAPIVQLVWYRRAVQRGLQARDCIAMTWVGAGLLAVWHLWMALGLPGYDT